jgi:hypothetical protein
MQKTHQYGFTLLLVTLILVMASVAAFLAWQVFNRPGNQVASTPVNTTPKTDPNAGYVVIEEWDVRFKPVEGLNGVQYFKPANSLADSVSFTTDKLANLESGCSKAAGGIVLGLLTRSQKPNIEYGGVFATINGHSYQYRISGAACSTKPENMTLEDQTGRMIIDSIKSLEARAPSAP